MAELVTRYDLDGLRREIEAKIDTLSLRLTGRGGVMLVLRCIRMIQCDTPLLSSRGPSAHGRSSVGEAGTQSCYRHRLSPV